MKIRFGLSTVAALFLLVTGCNSNNGGDKVQQVKTADDLSTKMASGVVVIDARGTDSYAKGHVPNSKDIGVEKMTPEMLPQDKAAPVVFYCGSTQCPVSDMAASKAVKWGYTNVWVYKGGIADWKASGKEVATGTN